MEIKVSEDVIEIVVNSLRSSQCSLRAQLLHTTSESQKKILVHQLKDVKRALNFFINI